LSRRAAAITAGSAAVIALVLGLLVRIRVIEEEFDLEWMEEIVEHRSPFWEVPSRVFDVVGGGWIGVVAVPLVITALLLLARRPWGALVFLAASAVSAGIVQGVKALFSRARPEDILLDLHSGAYPSGHVANAATMAVLLAVLIPRWWVAVAGAGYVVLMALSRTYLGAHWLTDTVGGALLGAAIGLAAWALLAPRLRAENLHREQRSRPASVGS
jgi:membrane-associated phospholipid phosphatase